MTAPNPHPQPDERRSGSANDDPRVESIRPTRDPVAGAESEPGAGSHPAADVPVPHPADLETEVACVNLLIAAARDEGVTGRTPATLATDARSTYDAVRVAMRAGDWKTARTRLATLGAILDRGADTIAADNRLLRLLEAKRKLVDTWVKTRSDTKPVLPEHVYTLEEISVVIRALCQAIMRAVTDRRVHRQIFNDFKLAMSRLDIPLDVSAPTPPGAPTAPGDTPSIAAPAKGPTDDDITRED